MNTIGLHTEHVSVRMIGYSFDSAQLARVIGQHLSLCSFLLSDSIITRKMADLYAKSRDEAIISLGKSRTFKLER